MLHLTFLALLVCEVFSNPLLPRAVFPIPSTSFNSLTTFNTYWNYDYPWGTDHNGAARMNSSQVAVASGQLTLTAKPVTGQKPTSAGIAINYLSGTIYAKNSFTVAAGGGYDFIGQFLAPTTRGTWPAFWLSGVNTWPPEIDMAEWKGNGDISFNTYGMNSVWNANGTNVPYDSTAFHTIKVSIRDKNGVDVVSEFYMDGKLESTQTGLGMIGRPFWLIIDYQMEGSSGSPGPTSSTKYSVKGLSVQSYNP